MSDFDWGVLAVIAFFAMIAVACWATASGWPLIAVLLTPSIKRKE